MTGGFMPNRDNSFDADDYFKVRDFYLPRGVNDDLHGHSVESDDDDDADDEEQAYEDQESGCGCCDECKWAEESIGSCDCLKCETCGECENSCKQGFCGECRKHDDECECDKVCGCCDECVENEWSEGECQCAQCETCLACENTCLEEKCENCFSHIVDGTCANCGAIWPLEESIQSTPQDLNKPMGPKRAFRNWSKSEKSIMRSLFTSGMPLAEIASHLNRTENAVVVQLANLGLLSDVDLSNAVHQAQLRYNRATKPDPETPF
jgi:hypothetical protein